MLFVLAFFSWAVANWRHGTLQTTYAGFSAEIFLH